MLDILGAMILPAFAVLAIGVLAWAGTRDGRKRRRLALLGGTWFVIIAGLGAAGIFSRAPLGTPALGVAVLLPPVVGLIVSRRSRSTGGLALSFPLATLVVIHAGRLIGLAFLALHSAGELPRTFAMSAGWGDIFIGATAVPLALAIHRRTAGWWWLTLLWNVIGALDLLTAVTLGAGSATNSPVRFIFESPASDALASLPWVLVPGFFVPFFLLTHAAVFAHLARTAHESRVRLPQIDGGSIPISRR